MRIFLACLIIVLTFAGCSGGNRNNRVQIQRLEYDSGQSGETLIRVIDSKTSARLGESAFVTIEGSPGIPYSITCSYLLEHNAYTSMETKTANDEGLVTFKWNISQNTTPGSYKIVISGDGESLTLPYTVAD